MALIDSGLGWSADENYMIQGANALGIITSIGGSAFPGQPVPTVATPADFNAQAFNAFTIKDPTNSYYTIFVGGWNGLILVAGVGTLADGVTYYTISDANTSTYQYTSTHQPNYPVVTRPSINASSPSSTRSYNASTGLYTGYIGPYMTNYWTIVENNVPLFNTLQDALDAVATVRDTIYKLNSGYAAGLWAKFKFSTIPGHTFISPILISSNRAFSELSVVGTTSETDPKASITKDGIVFYTYYLTEYESGSLSSTILPVHDLTETPYENSRALFEAAARIVSLTITNPPDPYEEQGGESSEEGGAGEETEDDPVGDSVHTIPSGGAFYRIFSPTLSQLQSLASYMWGTLDLNNIKRLYANPMDSILGLGVVPLNLSGSSMTVYIGGVDTGLSFPLISDEVYQVPFGYINVAPRWGCYLDYEPYTKLTIYLPFIGYKEINTDEFMGKQLILNYSIDIVTGACVARISVSGGSVLYQFSGQCLKQLPVTSGNWDNALRTAISSAAALGATIASQGATAPVLAGAVASASVQALSMKPNIEKSGNLSGMAGMMGGYRPFLIRSQPVQVIPGNQNKFIGYPSFVTRTLNDISGYNEISSVHLEGIPATGNELAEIESLLKGGVIL